MNKFKAKILVASVFLICTSFPNLTAETPKKENDFPESYSGFTEEENPFTVKGFIRQMVRITDATETPENKGTDYPSDSVTSIRLGFLYEKSNVKFEFEGNKDIIFSNYMDEPSFDFTWMRRNRNRLLYMEDQGRTDSYFTRDFVHRMYWSYNSEKFKFSAGRQAISWGQGRFLNPLDLITPTGPFILDIEDVAGSDSVDFTYYLGTYNMIEAVIIPYRRKDNPDLGDLRYLDTNSLLRFKGTHRNLDYSLIGGHHFHSWVWGVDLSLTAFDASFRFAYLGRSERNLTEYPHYNQDDLPPQVSHQVVLGTGYKFFNKLSTNFEIFYNSACYSKNPAFRENLSDEALISTDYRPPYSADETFFATSGRITTKNPVLIELSLSHEVTDLITASIFFIGDPAGRSAMYGPSLNYNISDNAVISGGGWLSDVPSDKEHAEFSSINPMGYLFMRMHF